MGARKWDKQEASQGSARSQPAQSTAKSAHSVRAWQLLSCGCALLVLSTRLYSQLQLRSAPHSPALLPPPLSLGMSTSHSTPSKCTRRSLTALPTPKLLFSYRFPTTVSSNSIIPTLWGLHSILHPQA